MDEEVQILSFAEYPGYLKRIVTLWNNNLKSSFPISKDLFERNLLGNSSVNKRNCYIALADKQVVGFIVSKESYNKGSRLNPIQVWLSALLVDQKWRRKGIGNKLIDRFEREITNNQEVLVGMDPYHLFPGIPLENTETINFFKYQGYTVSGKAYDLRANISGYKREYTLDESLFVRKLQEGEQERLLELIKENFSQRWYSDTKEVLDGERGIDGTIGLFKNEKLIGFAHVHTFINGYIGPSVFWKELLGEKFGGLGPIGVAKAYQGKGLGTAFFEEIILLLQGEGVHDMTVDWTVLLNYYGKFGFKPWKTYIHASKKM